MIDLLAGFIQELRSAGLPVSLTENLDAMEAVKHIPIEDREAFKFALAATLVKNNAHWRAFETVFEVYFSLRGPQYQLKDDADADELWRDMQDQLRQGDGRGAAGGGMESLTPEELAHLLYQALMNGDEALLRALARQAVSRYAGMEPGRPVGGTYYLYRTLRNLDLEAMLDRLMEATREQVGGELTPLEERLEQDEYQARIDAFRQEIEAEIRRRLVAGPRGRGHGQDAAQAAARGRRLHARLPRRDGRRSARRSTRSPASSRPAWPASDVTAARARWTSAARCGTRSRTAACRPSRSSSTPAPPSPSSWWSPTSPVRWPPSPGSR